MICCSQYVGLERNEKIESHAGTNSSIVVSLCSMAETLLPKTNTKSFHALILICSKRS